MVMPFGLTNAPPTFQRVMDEMMGSMQGEWSWIHMDDLLVYSKTFDDHLQHLEETFKRIRERNLFIKIGKCEFAPKSMEYLGHVISNNGIGMDPKKVKAVAEAAVPTDRTKL